MEEIRKKALEEREEAEKASFTALKEKQEAEEATIAAKKETVNLEFMLSLVVPEKQAETKLQRVEKELEQKEVEIT